MKIKQFLSKKNIVLILLFICSVTVLSFFLPGTDASKYEYSVGKPWRYDDLKAPEDNIVVELDPETKQHRTDSINANFRNVFRKDASVGEYKIGYIDRMMKDFGIPDDFRSPIAEKIRNVYKDGIVSNDVYDRISERKIDEIKILGENKEIVNDKTKGIRSEKLAYLFVDSAFKYISKLYIFADSASTNKIDSVYDAFRNRQIITPNIVKDTVLSQKLLNDAFSKALVPEKVLQKGERVVSNGEVITPQTFSKIEACLKVLDSRFNASEKGHYPEVGQVLFIIILLFLNFMFFKVFRKKFFNDLKKMTFVMTLITVFTFVVYFVSQKYPGSVYIIPFVMIPVLLTVFFDSRSAIYVHIIEIFLCSMVASNPIEFIFVQFVAGVAAITSLRELSKRSQLIQCALIVFVAYAITYTVFIVIKTGNVLSVDYRMLLYFLANSALLSFTYIVIFIFEKIFGFISPVTLVELSDVSNPLLCELSEKCPGTFQHSLQVSSLASEAAQKINANVLLVRAGALYHDIGKMSNPNYFTENQIGPSPHKNLTPEQSATIVINHVTDGLARAEKHNLPSVIRDFIAQHHGRGTAKYFYTTACNNNPDEEIDISKYTYPGPNPTSKETAILMMADSIEAASRSLQEYTEETIRALVNKIINSQIADGLLDNCPLSFNDVNIIKDTFVNRLKSIYHTRVTYPELNRNKKE